MNTRPLILVVDDDSAVRATVRLYLETAGYSVSGYASAISCLDDDVSAASALIADIRMPEMSGLQLLREIARRGLGLPIIFITGYGDVAVAVEAMRGGAIDFIEKPFDEARLLGSVAKALALSEQTRIRARDAKAAQMRLSLLTSREREVFELLVSGDPNKITAFKLGISPRTIEIHRSRIMRKMEARNLSDLVRTSLAAPQSPAAYQAHTSH